MNWRNLQNLQKLGRRFLLSSIIATSFEYVLYAILIEWGWAKRGSQAFSYICAVLVKFLLEKQFVFSLERKLPHAFLGAMLVSLSGWALNFGIYSLLMTFSFFSSGNHHHYFAKLIATGIVFFYNFFLKRYAFEKKFV